jgi:hypothetical protein
MTYVFGAEIFEGLEAATGRAGRSSSSSVLAAIKDE